MVPLRYSIVAAAACGLYAAAAPAAAFLLGKSCTTTASPTSSSPVRVFMSVPNPVDTLTSGIASVCRMPGGVSVSSAPLVSQTIVLKELYDVENSRECRAVRERITELDLVVNTVVPAAPNSQVFGDPNDPFALPTGAAIPRLILTDSEGRDVVLSGEEAILEYLNQAYAMYGSGSAAADGDRDDLQRRGITFVREVASYAPGVLRLGRGARVCGASKRVRPDRPLVLYSYEGNQFCRLVREVLTELDLVYELRSAGKGSPRREELASVSGGSTQCPFLIDPNTGASMLESADIIRYLYQTYAFYTPPNELLQWASDVVLPFIKPMFAVLAPIQAGSRSENPESYQRELARKKSEIQSTNQEHDVVVYTYDWSPFSTECKAVLDNLRIDYHEVSLGPEWIPGLIKEGGAMTRAALLSMTGQSSLPHIFVKGESLGGLFSGTPGLLKSLENGSFHKLLRISRVSQSPATMSSAINVEDSEAFA
jgi:anaphase-promoting complex subunit 7